jgi:hypothetical protein
MELCGIIFGVFPLSRFVLLLFVFDLPMLVILVDHSLLIFITLYMHLYVAESSLLTVLSRLALGHSHVAFPLPLTGDCGQNSMMNSLFFFQSSHLINR